jgi:hypothetical protein
MIMAKEFQQANLFELNDADIQVTYTSSSLDGSPLFSYRDANINCQFNGDEIRSVKTEIGEILTVTLEEILDFRTVTFTVILPAVTVLPMLAGTRIQVAGITTTTHTAIGGSIPGPQKSYSQVNLKGVAQFVIS